MTTPLPDVAVGQSHVAAHNAERHAINDHIGLGGVVIPTPEPADGSLLAYSHALGIYVETSPTGAPELAEAENSSGVAIPLNTQSYGGTVYTALSGTSLTIPASNGRPVILEWWGLLRQDSAGDGTMWCSVKNGATDLALSIHTLPVGNGKTPDGSTYLATFRGSARLAALTAPLTVQLNAMVYRSPTGSSPTVSVLPLSNAPLTIRAVQG